jgi:uroporphyrinogen-III decarboxylase
MRSNPMDFHQDYSCFQEGSRRLEAAMSGIPDRVPVYAQIHEFARKELGVSAKEFYTTPRVLVPGVLEVTERYGLDVPFADYDVYNIEAEALGQEIVYCAGHVPDVDRTRPLVRDRSDLSRINTPDFDSDARLPQVSEMNLLFKDLTGIEPTLQFCAPFSLAANVRGIEPLLMDIYSDPDFARGLLERLTEEVIAPWIQHQKRLFPNAKSICGSDATASLPIVNMHILEKWAASYILRLREWCGPEVYVSNWVGDRYLANPEEMLDLKLKVCPTLLEGQDPDVERLGPAIYKEYAERRGVPLVLGVGASFMALSTPEEVTNRVRHYVEVGGRNGRFALYLCNLGPTTPRENVRATVDAVATYGVY